MPPGEQARTIKTTATVFDILETLKQKDGAGITEVANELGLAKSTVHRHLITLEERAYVRKEDGEYHVGLKFLQLGEFTRTRLPAYQLARSKVAELAERTGERSQFIVEEHGTGVYLYRASGEHAVETDSGVGKRIPLHATAAGKAILSSLPAERREEIIEERGLPAITNQTITDPEEIEEECELIAERGYSYNTQENLKGLRAVGVPIHDGDGDVIGALSLSGPTNRMKGELFESELPDLLLGVANELELNIQYS